MPVVVIRPAILGIAMEDEAADYAEAALQAVQRDGALAPSIFWYELRNVLVVNKRRGRIAAEKTAAFLALVADQPIELSGEPAEGGVLELARNHYLSVYDAAYLEFALRTSGPLASLDSGLLRAAEKVGAAGFR